MWIHKSCNTPVRQESNQSSDGCGNTFAERYWWCDHCMSVVSFVGQAGDELREYLQAEKEKEQKQWAAIMERAKENALTLIKEIKDERDGQRNADSISR